MISIAIDGPSGAGKSSIARTIAAKIGYIYVDTGALYRALGLKLSSVGLTPNDTDKIIKVLKETSVEIAFVDGEQHVLLDGKDVSGEIRTPAVSAAASGFSAVSSVREHLLFMQRDIASKNNVIMDGRDIGTVVLPNADIKIFLFASAEDRAQRRYDELLAKGQDVTYDQVLADMKQRDYNDSHREIAPLRKAESAVEFDTTGNTFEESVSLLYDYIKSRGAV